MAGATGSAEGWPAGPVSPTGYFVSGVKANLVRIIDRFSSQRPADFTLPSDFVPKEIAIGDDGASLASLDVDGRLWAPGKQRAAPCPFLPPAAEDRGRLIIAPGSEYVATDYRVRCGDNTCRRVMVIRPSECKLVFDRYYDDDDFRELSLAADGQSAPRLIVGMRDSNSTRSR